MMQPMQEKPANKAWLYVIYVVIFIFFAGITYGKTHSFMGWIIINLSIAILFAAVLIINHIQKGKRIPFLLSLTITPVITYSFFYFFSLFLTMPISYMIAYGSCVGSAIGRLAAGEGKEKTNKYALLFVTLGYVLLGYFTLKFSWK